jgi:hypothetical protein
MYSVFPGYGKQIQIWIFNRVLFHKAWLISLVKLKICLEGSKKRKTLHHWICLYRRFVLRIHRLRPERTQRDLKIYPTLTLSCFMKYLPCYAF